jgi:hypothetical protein
MNHKDYIDMAALTGAAGAMFNVLPDVAAFLAIVWTSIRIYEWARVRIFGKDKDMEL